MSINTNNRLTIIVPFSILEIIDRIVSHRSGDGERNVSRTSVAVGLLKIGARVEKKKLDNIESGANPFDSRLEEQLSFIANIVTRSEIQIKRFFNLYAELQNVDANLFNRIIEETKLTDKEVALLKRLFVDLK